ncbi:MAG: recombinase family protein [Candidatus Limnocylindrales bacterium]
MSAIVRVATYTRISTDETNQPYSLGAQHDRLDAFVASQPDWQIVARYTDQASGKSLERPALREARAAAAAGRFDLLLVYRVDRLSRNLGQLVGLIEEFKDRGVGFRSATEPFDTANPAGRMLVQLLGTFAEFERASMMDRIGAGMERKASRGEWTGGTPPYGYLKPPGTSVLAPDPATAPVAVAIFRRYVETREGGRAIAAWLDGQGVRTRTGGRWSTSSVLDLLRNRAAIGEISFRGVWGPGAHEPIVERTLFDAAGAILDARAGDPALRRTNPTDYLLSTLPFVCDRCGHPMIGASARGRGGVRYAYYTCASRAKRGPSACDQARLPKDDIEAAIFAQMTEVYADTGLVGAALEEAASAAQAAQTEAEGAREGLRREGTELRRKLARYFAAFEAGELDAPLVQSRLAELQAQLAAIEGRLAATPTPDPSGASGGPVEAALVSWALSQALGRVLAQGPRARTKALLRLLVGEIRVISPADIRPIYRVPVAVRTPEELVGEGGLEPPTGGV